MSLSSRASNGVYSSIPDAIDQHSRQETQNQAISNKQTGFNHFSKVVVFGAVLFICVLAIPSLYRGNNSSSLLRETAPVENALSGATPVVEETTPIKVYQSSLAGDRFTLLTPVLLKARGVHVNALSFGNKYIGEEFVSDVASVSVDTDKLHQEILGFGGAFTEAAALNYQKLSAPVQKRFVDLYFGESGIGYSMGRIHINSCDFCVSSYTFDDVAGDVALDHFDMTVQRDQEAILPLIRDAITASSRRGKLNQGTGIRLVASPWSPPAWMKVPVPNTSSAQGDLMQTMLGSAHPNGLREDMQQVWANYMSRFIEAYHQQGVPIWAITPQNEPENAAPWEACVYMADFQARFVARYLGPTMNRDHPELLILAFDHNKDHLVNWADEMMGNKTTGSAPYVAGMAFHWYNGADDRTLDGTSGFSAIRATRDKYPNAILLATEGCSCPGVEVGNWFRGERLGHDLMFDIINGARGWIDWNLLVDYTGGPNHLDNRCDAPLVMNEINTDIIIQPKYYYMGHFSKHIPPGSKMLSSRVIGNYSNSLDNPNIQSGVELGVFACEHSSRQLWTLGPDMAGVIELTVPAFADTQLSTTAIRLCIIPPAAPAPSAYLRIGDCYYGAAPIQFETRKVAAAEISASVKRFIGASARVFQLTYSSPANSELMCLGVDKSTYNGATGGSMLMASPCETTDKAQLWIRKDVSTGGDVLGINLISIGDSMQASSKEGGGSLSCLTAGWPFLTASAFNTGESTVIVVMNESPKQTNYAVSSSAEAKPMLLGISARAIQTVVF